MYTFEQLISICNDEIAKINFKDRAPLSLYEPILYTLENSGKRLRPVATLMSTNLFTDNILCGINTALALEVFHNFTLLHDDIMDNASTRRGKPSVHKKWNENVAILSGDAMMLCAYKFLAKNDKMLLGNLLEVFNEVTLQVCEGQQLDMEFETAENVTVDDYLNMIRLKTSVLIAGAMKMGAICGGATPKEADVLYEIGLNLGLAFQIQDDVLDTYSDKESFGKEIGGDILEGKKTYLLLTTYGVATAEDTERLNTLFSAEIENELKISSVRAIYDKYNVKELANEKVKEFYEKALSAIDSLEVEDSRKEPLRELSNIILTRKK
ncbi:MAG: polyprenyl synthetase family protein [Rikenellaceae bacterium]